MASFWERITNPFYRFVINNTGDFQNPKKVKGFVLGWFGKLSPIRQAAILDKVAKDKVAGAFRYCPEGQRDLLVLMDTVKNRVEILSSIPPEEAALILEKMQAEGTKILQSLLGMDPEKAASILEYMTPDVVAKVFNRKETNPKADAKKIKEILSEADPLVAADILVQMDQVRAKLCVSPPLNLEDYQFLKALCKTKELGPEDFTKAAAVLEKLGPKKAAAVLDNMNEQVALNAFYKMDKVSTFMSKIEPDRAAKFLNKTDDHEWAADVMFAILKREKETSAVDMKKNGVHKVGDIVMQTESIQLAAILDTSNASARVQKGIGESLRNHILDALSSDRREKVLGQMPKERQDAYSSYKENIEKERSEVAKEVEFDDAKKVEYMERVKEALEKKPLKSALKKEGGSKNQKRTVKCTKEKAVFSR